MSPEQTLYDTLRQYSAVTAIVAQRIYPDALPPEPQLPAVVYERAGSEPQYGLNSQVLITKATLRVLCLAPTRVAAEELADAVIAAMATVYAPPEGRAGEYDVETETAVVAVDFDIWY
jgi:hypothetical protein